MIGRDMEIRIKKFVEEFKRRFGWIKTLAISINNSMKKILGVFKLPFKTSCSSKVTDSQQKTCLKKLNIFFVETICGSVDKAFKNVCNAKQSAKKAVETAKRKINETLEAIVYDLYVDIDLNHKFNHSINISVDFSSVYSSISQQF